jgi:YkoY family integral membrane protein
MQDIYQFLHNYLGPDLKAAGFIILNLLMIESLLSVDNAAVLATMVMDLPKEQRARALKYGILGAYVFRGLCLVFASFLIKFIWLKPLGGLYLLYLAAAFFLKRKKDEGQESGVNKQERKIYSKTVHIIGPFWSTIILVELMDLAFSIDNVFAAVAYTANIYLIIIGVFIGILAMRFVAQGFVKLMERFTFLEISAYVVIAILGFKLILSFCCEMGWCGNIKDYIQGQTADIYTSIITVSVFLIPIVSSLLFNFPKRNKRSADEIFK